MPSINLRQKPPSNGSLGAVATNGKVNYTPNPNFNGTDSFTFKVNDGTVDSSVATVTITVTAVNDTPTATAQSITVDEDIRDNTITLAGRDIDGNALYKN